MSLLSSILGKLTTPKNNMGVKKANDFVNETVIGSSNNDALVFDVRSLHGANSSNITSLDGGNGIDTLTLQLTQSQYKAMKLEMKAKLGGLFNDRLDLGELVTLFKVFTGQQYVKIDALDLQLKGWEYVKFDVCEDPVAPPLPTYIDTFGRGNFSGSDKSIDLDLASATKSLQFEENVPQQWDVTKVGEVAYFEGGNEVPGFSFTPWQYIGSSLSDQMVGDDTTQAFSGESGNDFLYGKGGYDELRGEGGDDYLDGGDGDDWLVGGEGNDRLEGGNGNDRLAGQAGDDDIVGDSGDDLIDGGNGNDHIDGGAGNDTIVYRAGEGSDLTSGGEGSDTLDVTLNGGDAKRYFVQATGGGFDLYVQGLAAQTEEANAATGVEKINLALGDNEALILHGNLAGVTDVTATGGNMLSLATLSSATKVIANLGAGDDTFLAGGHSTGADVDGGEGGEFNYGDFVDYSQIGQPVNLDLQAGTATRNGASDKILNFESAGGTIGNDTIVGSTEDNFLWGRDGNDVIRGGEGNDHIDGGAGNDTLFGDAGQDWMFGGDGQDTLSGGAGNDTLDGEDGNDTMRGGDGADILTGGAGHDSMYAGLNDGDADVFKFGADAVGSQSNVWASADYIYEFDATNDVVEIKLATGEGKVTLQTVGGNTHAYITGDFDGVVGTETIAMSFVGGGNGVSPDDFFFV